MKNNIKNKKKEFLPGDEIEIKDEKVNKLLNVYVEELDALKYALVKSTKTISKDIREVTKQLFDVLIFHYPELEKYELVHDNEKKKIIIGIRKK